MAMPLAKAIKEWETRTGKVAADEREIFLYGGMVFDVKRSFINKLDASLAALKNCERLALSTNQIDRMAPFTGMEKLRLLSLSRNALKKIERLEDVSETLEELWLSYNLISTLDGLGACQKLQVIYLVSAQGGRAGETEGAQGVRGGLRRRRRVTDKCPARCRPRIAPRLPARSPAHLPSCTPSCLSLLQGNNKIADWAELDKLAGLGSLREVLFTGNPIYVRRRRCRAAASGGEQARVLAERGVPTAPVPTTGSLTFAPFSLPFSLSLRSRSRSQDGMEKSAAKLQVLKRLPNLAKIDNDMVSPGERDAAKAL